jgi:hypothetical protein
VGCANPSRISDNLRDISNTIASVLKKDAQGSEGASTAKAEF